MELAERQQTCSFCEVCVCAGIPTEIFQLTSLTSLQLYENQLVGTCCQRRWVRSIDWRQSCVPLSHGVRARHFIGRIPTYIGQLTSLTKLSLNENQLTGGSALPTCSVLCCWATNTIRDSVVYFTTHMCARCCSLGPIPTEIGLLTSLVKIELSCNQLSGALRSKRRLVGTPESPNLHSQSVHACALLCRTHPDRDWQSDCTRLPVPEQQQAQG